jgi:KRAB domain-containing zinc finger protein
LLTVKTTPTILYTNIQNEDDSGITMNYTTVDETDTFSDEETNMDDPLDNQLSALDRQTIENQGSFLSNDVKQEDEINVNLPSNITNVIETSGSCDVTFTRKVSIEKHYKNSHGSKNSLQKLINNDIIADATSNKQTPPIKCQFCDVTLSHKSALVRHEMLVHAIEEVPAREYTLKCSMSPKTFENQKGRNANEQQINLKRTLFSCVICEKQFTRNSQVYRHMRVVHEKVRDFNCEKCAQSFTCKRDLTKHFETVHLKLRPFQCAECNKGFYLMTKLLVHVKLVHEKAKPVIICNTCEKSFPTKKLLGRHRRDYHSPTGKFPCIQCDKSYKRRMNLKNHVNFVHKNTSGKQCDQCGKNFRNPKDLREHVSSFHLKLKPFQCVQCDLKFARKQSFNAHTRRSHLPKIEI